MGGSKRKESKGMTKEQILNVANLLATVSAIVLFAISLSQIVQMKGVITSSNSSNVISAQSVENVWKRKFENLSSKMEQMSEALLLANARIDWLRGEAGWYLASNGLMYKYFSSRSTTFEHSIAACQKHQADLITAGIRDENVRSEIRISSIVWIGLFRAETEYGSKAWKWLDGAQYNKSALPWATHHPYNSDGKRCAYMSNGYIYDYANSCSVHRSYICERQF